MSKREIEVVLYQCDHIEDNGERCERDGDREAIQVCRLCGKDICITHYELSTVSVQSTRDRFTYYFCLEHSDEFRQTLIDKYGDTGPVPQTGYGLAFN